MRIDCRWSVTFDNPAGDEVDQMRVDRTRGGAAQPRLQADVEPSVTYTSAAHGYGLTFVTVVAGTAGLAKPVVRFVPAAAMLEDCLMLLQCAPIEEVF